MDLDEEFKRIAAESAATLEPYLRRCIENLYRVGHLAGVSIREESADILRAAVVFLHATMEDCLRSVLAAYLPNASNIVLDRVPLLGSSTPRAEKFLLGRLSAHRAKTVDELINVSVREYLEHITFSRVSQIVEHLQPLGFETTPWTQYFGDIEQLMRRRHQIVHRADHNDAGELAPITKDEVIKWGETVSKFLAHVLAQAGNKEAFSRIEQLLVDIARERGIEL